VSDGIDIVAETTAPHDAAEREVELLISGLLRWGVSISLGLIVLGTIVSFVHHPNYLSQSPALHPLTGAGAAFPHSVRETWQGVKDFRGQSIIVLGLLLLIATPVVRVAVSILGFVRSGDRRYVVITTIVLILLLLSFALGKGVG
jgi:uncharacterized membrane protein